MNKSLPYHNAKEETLTSRSATSQAILSHGYPEVVKAARLVCKGWRPVHPRVQPSVPVRVSAQHRCPRPIQPASASARSATARIRRVGVPTAVDAAAAAPTRPSSTLQRGVDLLAWVSRCFPGELERDGRVVLTLVEGDSEGGEDTRAQPARTTRERASASRRRVALPAASSADDVSAPRTDGDHGDVCVDSGPAAAPTARPGGGRPLRDLLRHLAAAQHQHLRIQHSAAAPTSGLMAAAPACGCGSAGGVACGTGQASGWPSAAFLPATAAVLPPAKPGSSAAATLLPLSHCDAADCCHCCCGGPGSQPRAQRRLHAPGLGAVAALRDLRSLELSGVRVGTGLLGRLTALSQLTRLCFDAPLPTNRVSELAGLTSLECLHFTVTWPVQPPSAAAVAATAAEGGAAAGAVAGGTSASAGRVAGLAPSDEAPAVARGGSGAAGSAELDSNGSDDNVNVGVHGGINDNVSSSSSADGDGDSSSSDSDEGFESLTRARANSGALTSEPVAAALAALAPLRRLTHLRLRVSCGLMSRTFLLPPELLQQARAALPRLRRFAFQALSGWQPFPRTLYNWVAAADPGVGGGAGAGGLCRIRDSPTEDNQVLLIWQDFDWRLWEPHQPPPPPPPLSPLQSPGGRQRDGHGHGGGGGGGGGEAGAGGCTHAQGARRSSACGIGTGIGGGDGAVKAAAAVADVAVDIRTCCSSWLGRCMAAPAALNAVAASLPGCRVVSLALTDPQGPQDWKLAGGGELVPYTLEAVSELRSLSLRDIRRPPLDRAECGQPDCLLQLIRRPSLRALELETSCPRWLYALLPQPQPQPAECPMGRSPPARVRPGAAARAGGPSGSTETASAGATGAPPPPPPPLPLPPTVAADEPQRRQQQQQPLGGGARAAAAPCGGGGGGGVLPPPALEHLSLQLRGPELGRFCSRYEEEEQIDDEEEERDEGDEFPPQEEEEEEGEDGSAAVAAGGSGGGGGFFGAAGHALNPLRRLSLLQALVSLHLDIPAALLQASWLPGSLQHLSLVRVTLRLPPAQPTTAAAAAAAAAAAPLLPRLASLSALSCALPPLSALLPAAGCSHLTRLTLAGCHLASTSASTSAPGPACATTVAQRAAQLLMVSELEALVDCCAASLRSLRVTQTAHPGGGVAGWEVEAGGCWMWGAAAALCDFWRSSFRGWLRCRRCAGRCRGRRRRSGCWRHWAG
ncbi:hypothetical protein PLESTM_000513400 [Pleodorina starrii]|nr:hypothetical protein PLESTM_000513400 [Pleodorina starrii]